MAPIQLYGLALSAPCRIVAMAAEVAGVDYEYVETSPMTGATKTPEFLALNPTHTIPTIKDGDFVLYESRAIASYILNKYCKDDKMLPKDPETKALVDARLYFDMGVFYKAFGDCVYPVMFGAAKGIEEKEMSRLLEVLGFLNTYVADNKFAAGTDNMTVADLALVATYSTVKASGVVDLSAFPNAESWFEKCKGLIPNYEKADGEGAAQFAGFYKSKA